MTVRTARLALVLVFLAFLGVSIYRFPAAGRDDIFIILWAGKTLGPGTWFSNYNLDTEDMVSSPFAALMAGMAHYLAPEAAFLVSKGLGLLAALATLALIWAARCDLFDESESRVPALLAMSLAALSPFFEYWALGGMGTPYYALFLTGTVVAFVSYARRPSARAAWTVAALQALALLVRAEAFWLLAASAGLMALLVRERGLSRRESIVLGFPALCFAAVIGLRTWYTGLPFPNPAYAKVGDLTLTIPNGLRYLIGFYASSVVGPLHAAVAAFSAGVVIWAGAALVHPGLRRRLSFSLVALCGVTVGNDVFVLLAGGDWMEYFRFQAATIPLKSVILTRLAFAGIRSERLGDGALARAAPACVALLLMAVAALQQGASGHNASSNRDNCSKTLPWDVFGSDLATVNERVMFLNCAHQRDLRTIRPFVEGAMGCYLEHAGRLVILTNQAGYFPYKVREHFDAERVRFIDPRGLINQEIARLPVPKDQSGLAAGNWPLLVLAGEAGPLSRWVEAAEPNMVYAHGNRSFDSAYAQLGYESVWSRSVAQVYFKNRAGEPWPTQCATDGSGTRIPSRG